MKKSEKEKISKGFEDFDSDLNLWSIITGGGGQGLDLMKNVVNASLYNKPPFMPRILIIGGENTALLQHAKALANSFCLDEIRETCCRYIDNDSSKIFFASNTNTGHLIYDAEEIRHGMESVLWRFLGLFWCGYSNPFDRNADLEIVTCKGLVVLTVSDKNKVNKRIVDAVDYVVQLEEYLPHQLHQVVQQRLKYYSVDYQNEDVIDDIVMNGEGKFENMMRFLRICLDVAYADMRQNLTLEDIELAAKLK